jgi:hypothetical protein
VLTDLIRELDDSRAQQLAFVFAERAIEVCGDALSSEERHASLSYLAAARNLINGKGNISDLRNAHQVYFSARNQHTRLSDEITWVAAIAVATSCQRQMEEFGITAKNRYVPGLLNVAQDAQAVAGRYAALNEGESEDGADIARRARWLEAKWQLLRLIESVPFPESPPGDLNLGCMPSTD